MTAEEFVKLVHDGETWEDMLNNDELYADQINIVMENYANLKSDLEMVDRQSACNLINNALPENSVLFKDGHECWHYYYDDEQFDKKESPLYSQELHESFEEFIKRVVKSLICHEDIEGYEWPLVRIDTALL